MINFATSMVGMAWRSGLSGVMALRSVRMQYQVPLPPTETLSAPSSMPGDGRLYKRESCGVIHNIGRLGS